MLWTRVTARGRDWTDVSWSVARIRDDAHRRARQGRTGAARDFTVKVDVTGLAPATTYYYRFEAERQPVAGRADAHAAARERCRGCASASCRARTCRSATSTPTRRWRPAPISTPCCTSATTSTSTPNGEFGDGTAFGRVPAPDKEIVTLADYRTRHAQYKADPDSQEVHRQHPFIVVWDDHELANNTWWGGAREPQS